MNESMEQSQFLSYFLKVQPALRGYLLAAVRDPMEADELMQEVAMVMWRKFAEFDRKRDFRPWAMGIARLQILKQRQEYARSKLMFSDEALAALASCAAEEAAVEDVRLAYLPGCIEKLPPEHKKMLNMRIEKNQSMAEIGAYFGKSSAAIQMILVRVRRWLRECVDETVKTEQARL